METEKANLINGMSREKILKNWTKSEGQLEGLLVHLEHGDVHTAKHLRFALELARRQIQIIRKMPSGRRSTRSLFGVV